jgi:hypothetical protein
VKGVVGSREDSKKGHTSRPPRTLPTIVPANFPPVNVDDPFWLFPAAAEAEPLGDVELEEEELGRGARANPQTDISVLAIISFIPFDPSSIKIEDGLTRVTTLIRFVSRTMST